MWTDRKARLLGCIAQKKISCLRCEKKETRDDEFESNVAWLASNQLEVLLNWKGVGVSKMGSVAKRRASPPRGRSADKCVH